MPGLSYNYPEPIKFKYTRTPSESVDLDQLLDIGEVPSIPEPQMVNEPIESISRRDLSSTDKDFLEALDDPLADILAESQAQIKQHQVLLPSQRFQQIDSSAKSTQAQGAKPNQIASKTISSETHASPHKPYSAANDSMADPLACHADNIMRMAMDSTMLGSFCNETISSSFSNVLDESILERNHDRSLGDDSFHVRKNARAALNFSNATKVEISAQDLEMAVNDPLRLA